MPIVRRSRSEFDPKGFDWNRADAATDADVAREAAADPETAPPLTDAQLASAHPVVSVPTPAEIRAVRERLGLTQAAFAARFGVSVETLRTYEQGRRVPSGPVRILLRVIAREPEAVARALRG